MPNFKAYAFGGVAHTLLSMKEITQAKYALLAAPAINAGSRRGVPGRIWVAALFGW